MRNFICIIVGLLITATFSAQDVIGVRTVWSDSFREWEYLTEDEYRSGRLYMRWPLNDDWTQWDLRIGDTIADMRLKWPDDPNLWEIQCMGTKVTARTMWSGDFRQWRIDDGTHRLVLKSKFGNTLDEWILRDDKYGEFAVYTYYERDPRDWVVYDMLDSDVSYAMRLALIFIAVYHSSPKI